MKILSWILLLLITNTALAGWVPPNNPVPKIILDEARMDARSGNYEDALAKHLWFHNNALKYQKSLYGVRLSFALLDWKRLSSVHPPALEKMKETRDKSEEFVQKGINAFENFLDFEALNKTLDENEETTRLFSWLDENKPKVATDLFRIAQAALVRTESYELAYKYIDPNTSFERIISEYDNHQYYMSRYSKKWDKRRLEQTKFFGEMSFTNSTSTLVALLVLKGEKAAAKNISKQALLKLDSPRFRKELDRALNGKVPKAWPP